MFGLITKKRTSPHYAIKTEERENYTRFHPRQANTRFAPKPAPAKRVTQEKQINPVAPERPAPRVELVRPGKIDENAHLHTDAKVSITILRKALPLRFAEISRPSERAVTS